LRGALETLKARYSYSSSVLAPLQAFQGFQPGSTLWDDKEMIRTYYWNIILEYYIGILYWNIILEYYGVITMIRIIYIS